MKKLVGFLLAAAVLLGLLSFTGAEAMAAGKADARAIKIDRAYTMTGTKKDTYSKADKCYTEILRFTIPAKGTVSLRLKSRASVLPTLKIYNEKNTKSAIWKCNAKNLTGKEKENGIYQSKWNRQLPAGTYYVKVLYTGKSMNTKYKFTAKYKPTFAGTQIEEKTGREKALDVRLSEANAASGYQLQVSLKENMARARTFALKGRTNTLKSVTGLRDGTTYYFRARSYKKAKVDGLAKVYYGSWTAVASVKTDEAISTPTPTPTEAPKTSVQEEAEELAESLGVAKEELHGKYELFLEYADCVVGNPKLAEYRTYLLHLFPMVADHLSEENKEFFLQKVREIRIETFACPEGVLGQCSAWDNKVTIDDSVYEDYDSPERLYAVVYHELTHFVDFFIDGELASEDQLYFSGERIVRRKDLTEEELKTAKYLYARFIAEGGAELFAGKYFSKNPNKYSDLRRFLTGFEWIFGSQALEELFFGKYTEEQFAGYLRDSGYSDYEIVQVIESFNYFVGREASRPENPVRVEDVLIDLYEHNRETDWKEDKVFCYILSIINNDFYYEAELRHTELADIALGSDQLSDIRDNVVLQVDEDLDRFIPFEFEVLFLNQKPYLYTRILPGAEKVWGDATSLLVEYDFENAKALSSTYYTPPYPVPVPEPLPAGDALEARLASFTRDPSVLHEQTAYTGSSPELQALYKRAAELGNKYGVYIYLGDAIPDYIVHGIITDTAIKLVDNALDALESVLGKFPDGFFERFVWGDFTGLEFYLLGGIDHHEVMTYRTGDVYRFGCEVDYWNVQDKAEQEERIADIIFSATDLLLKSYFENFADPSFSEKIWRSLKPEAFTYIGDKNGDNEKELYETYKDEFANFAAMRCATKERTQLMMSILQGKPVSGKCLAKAEFYSRCIREAFDDSAWPAKTAWEEEIERQKQAAAA